MSIDLEKLEKIKPGEYVAVSLKAHDLLKSYKKDISDLTDEAIKDTIINNNIDEKYQKKFEERTEWLKRYAKMEDNPLVLESVIRGLSSEPKNIKQAVITKLRGDKYKLTREIEELREKLCNDIVYLNIIEKLLDIHDHL